jgi:S1-C subfamily serine protease
VEKNGLRAKKGKGVEAVTGWGVGGPTRAWAKRGGPLVFGGQTINGAVVELASDKGGAMAVATLAGNIGAGILKRFVVTLDYEHNTLYLKPTSQAVSDLDTFDRAGMWLNRDPKGFKIVDVTHGTPAEDAGLKAGDLIVAVDGVDATKIKLPDLRVRLRNDAVGTKVSFSVEHAGKKAERVVVLRDLI